jgi:hypothetical protein
MRAGLCLQGLTGDPPTEWLEQVPAALGRPWQDRCSILPVDRFDTRPHACREVVVRAIAPDGRQAERDLEFDL